MRTIEMDLTAWIAEHSRITPQDLATSKRLNLYYLQPERDMSGSGWARVGSARVIVTLNDEKDIFAAKVDALRKEKDKILGDAQAKATEIEGKIQNLLAITYQPDLQP